jgi:hypothetical protein
MRSLSLRRILMIRGSQRRVKIVVFVMPEVIVGNPFFSSGFPLKNCGNDGF